jgi:hypothetical protein
MDRDYPTITPGLPYHNAYEMIDWLCRTFGLKKSWSYREGREKLNTHIWFSIMGHHAFIA